MSEIAAVESVLIKALYTPQDEGPGPRSHCAHIRLQSLGGTYVGEIWGMLAEGFRKQYKLPCREWVTMRLRLEACDE